MTSPLRIPAVTCGNDLAPTSPRPRPGRSHMTSPLAPALQSGARSGQDRFPEAERPSWKPERDVMPDAASPAPGAFPTVATAALTGWRSRALTCSNAVPFYRASTDLGARPTEGSRYGQPRS
jgi:hypothetical protein